MDSINLNCLFKGNRLFGPECTLGIAARIPSTFSFKEVVRQAMAAVAEADPLVFLVDTDDLQLKSDSLHFGTEGQLGMGTRFAEACRSDVSSRTPCPASASP